MQVGLSSSTTIESTDYNTVEFPCSSRTTRSSAFTKTHHWKVGKKDITRGRPADETSDDEINDEEKIDEKMKAKLRIGRYGYHMLP
jgi:hypothetical protein